MAIVNTLRPTAVISSSGWTPTGGTASAVTADDSDATYNTWGGVGSPLVLSVGSHTPSAGHARHLVRGRVRGEDGSVVWFVQLANGSLVAPSTAELPAAPATVNGSYDASSSLPLTGATTLAIRVVGQTTGVRTQELYVDVHTREAPTFTPEVYDGSSAENTTVTDTNSPEVGVSALDTDDLQLLRYHYWVTDAGANIVWDTGEVGSGSAPQLSIAPLENGSYTLHIILWTAIGANTPYASDEETLAFTINTTVTQPPESVEIEQVEGEPYFDIMTCAPSDMSDWDDSEAYVEIQRTDCNDENKRIAIVGPIGADECVTYRDWTVTRSLPENCRDDEDDCPTTWRVRFVGLIDGLVTTSGWFGEPISPIVPGIIVGWSGTAASVPQGWVRETSLDSRYLKGITTDSTEPGSFGGATSHSHTTPGHVHSLGSHNHGGGGNTAQRSGTISRSQSSTSSTLGNTHTHTRSTPFISSVSSQSTTPNTSTVSNEVDRALLIWISAVTPAGGLPSAAVALMGDIAPAGWSTYTDATSRFLRGASPGANGGGTGASVLDSHTHETSSHTHAGTSHSHLSPNTSSFTGNINVPFANGLARSWSSHSHPITIGSTSTGTLNSASGGTSGTQTPTIPPWINIRVRQNDTGGADIPQGVIAVWLGSLSAIPTGWLLCDGTNGTPNMIDRYPQGATSSIATTGGSVANHTHTGSSHTHTISAHSHTSTIEPLEPAAGSDYSSGGTTLMSYTHTHPGSSNTDTATPTVTSASTGTLASQDSEPSHRQVAFIQFDELPAVTGSGEIVERELEWPEGEHLLRADTPDGPVFVSVCGTLSWDVERAFTVNQGIMGARQVFSSEPGGHDFSLVMAVRTEVELRAALVILNSALMLVSPADSEETWAAPVSVDVRVPKVGRVREVSVKMRATGPEPAPTVNDALFAGGGA